MWLPELEATVDFSQEAGRRHKDVWEHTKQVVRQSVPRPVVRWAALLHDIGKVPTRTFTPDGGVHFHRHAEVGARMFEDVARRFGFDKPMKQKLRFLILHHLRPNQYEAAWTDSAVRRFDREMQEHLTDLLDLSRADITSARPGKRQDALRNITELAARIQTLREEDAKRAAAADGHRQRDHGALRSCRRRGRSATSSARSRSRSSRASSRRAARPSTTSRTSPSCSG